MFSWFKCKSSQDLLQDSKNILQESALRLEKEARLQSLELEKNKLKEEKILNKKRKKLFAKKHLYKLHTFVLKKMIEGSLNKCKNYDEAVISYVDIKFAGFEIIEELFVEYFNLFQKVAQDLNMNVSISPKGKLWIMFNPQQILDALNNNANNTITQGIYR
jgi:hypothetical protein